MVVRVIDIFENRLEFATGHLAEIFYGDVGVGLAAFKESSNGSWLPVIN